MFLFVIFLEVFEKEEAKKKQSIEVALKKKR